MFLEAEGLPEGQVAERDKRRSKVLLTVDPPRPICMLLGGISLPGVKAALTTPRVCFLLHRPGERCEQSTHGNGMPRWASDENISASLCSQVYAAASGRDKRIAQDNGVAGVAGYSLSRSCPSLRVPLDGGDGLATFAISSSCRHGWSTSA